MKPSEMRAIYEEACRAASNRPVPDDAQEKIWRQTMVGFDAADLRGGLAAWWEKEKFLPMPAELKPLAERARRERIERSSVKKYLVVWVCRTCGHRWSGFLAMDQRGLRFCSSKWGPLLAIDAPRVNGQRPERLQLADGQTCGAELAIVIDDRAVGHA